MSDAALESHLDDQHSPVNSSIKPTSTLSEAQRAEVADARKQESITRRSTVPALEEILHEPIRVLDYGFIRVIDYLGSDEAVTQAARVSYGRGTKKLSNDKGLIRYLMRHRHTTPFEMCEIKLHVKLPIFVARQWIRHRTANVNEYSARYSVLDKEFYVPDEEFLQIEKENRGIEKAATKGQSDMFGPLTAEVSQIAAQSEENKQGRATPVTSFEADEVLGVIKSESARAYTNYLKLLNEDERGQVRDHAKSGIARELARMVLPVNYYTQWYWKIDLHNLFHFINLRADQHAQYEIRAYANVMADIAARWVPTSWQAFKDYRMDSFELSRPALKIVSRMLSGEKVTQEDSGLSKREWRELLLALGQQT